jgi:hypothetical protein
MNAYDDYPEEEEDEVVEEVPPPDIEVSEELRQRVELEEEPLQKIFERGDLVTPKLSPVYAEERRGEPIRQINGEGPFRVHTVIKTGGSYKLRFEDVEGKYDACFFKKAVPQKKTTFRKI